MTITMVINKVCTLNAILFISLKMENVYFMIMILFFDFNNIKTVMSFKILNNIVFNIF